MIGRYGPPIFQILRGIEGSYNVALMKAVPNKNLNNDYLFYLLKNKKIQDYVIKKSVRAAGQSGVNKATLEPFKVNIPPKNIQKKIIENVKLIEEKIKKISEISNVNLKNIELLKSLLLKNFITKNQHNE